MSAITPDTVLVRARDVSVRLGDADDVLIARGESRLQASPHALGLLHAFANAKKVSEVLEAEAAGPEHWIELTTAIMQLFRAGVLHAPGADAGTPRGFAKPAIHIVMLDDETRTAGFIAALRALVSTDDVVVDIGTGTGILATSASLAGARRVFAIESSAIGDAAEKVFVANGVAERVTLVRGRSTGVTLPERGSLLVTETIGNDPLDERILEIVSDAKARLLADNARIVPRALEILLVPFDVPSSVFERHVFTPERLAAWRKRYGVDLSSLASVRLTSSQPISVRTEQITTWRRVAPAVPLVSIDLEQPFELSLSENVRFALEQDAVHLGFVLAFRATLAPGIVLSTLPEDVSPLNSWHYALWPCLDEGRFERGSMVAVDYAYDRGTTTLQIKRA